MPHIVRHLGKVTRATLHDGTQIERQDLLLVKLGEQIIVAKQVDDDDHFLYQFRQPISTVDLIGKYKGVIPLELQGPNIMCTCGSVGNPLTDGPYAGWLMCESMGRFGKHQTSFKLKDGQMILDKKTASEYLTDMKDLIDDPNLRNLPKL